MRRQLECVMSEIQKRMRVTYFAPTKRRHYFSLTAAARAEARAQIVARYPAEEAEYEEGRMTYIGWNWTDEPRLLKAHRRLSMRIIRRFKAGQASEQKS
jgi:hypothetical protein